MSVAWIGYAGLLAFAIAWIPQSLQTIRMGRCDINMLFLVLTALGSFSVMLYALLRDDTIFFLLNALTTSGALLNFFYKLFPRKLA